MSFVITNIATDISKSFRNYIHTSTNNVGRVRLRRINSIIQLRVRVMMMFDQDTVLWN